MLAVAAAASRLATVNQDTFSRTLAQQRVSWADSFAMLSVVQADSTVVALSILSFHPDNVQSNHLLVVADSTGTLYIFTSRGQVIFEHETGKHSWHFAYASAKLQAAFMYQVC